MAQPGSSQPPPTSSMTDNPVEAVVAVGRRVKSALSSHQQPSVRIRRETFLGERHRVPVLGSIAEQLVPHRPAHGNAQAAELPQHHAAPAKENTFANRLAGAGNRAGASVRSLFGHEKPSTENGPLEYDEYDADTVDLLDVVDPEVSTLSTLTNVQNSLFVPSLGKVLNRRPTYRIRDSPGEARTIEKVKAALKRITSPTEGDEKESGSRLEGLQKPLPRIPTRSVLNNAQYAILPDGEILEGWKHEDEAELDDMVRHMLHSRRARFKRSMKGFSQYVRRPLGLFVTVYATLVTLFGLAWVLFLIGWISLGSKQHYIINVVDNVLVALFAIIGDGLAPFRAVDTYHMIYIAHYHRKTLKERKKMGLPRLIDHNDLPELRKEDIEPKQVDLESLVARRMPRGLARVVTPRIPKRLARHIVTHSKSEHPSHEYSVLTEAEQAKLEHHERKFSKSHTFYKPHETKTHYAFPFKLLIAVVTLLDMHSALQITLGACTWGINYKKRPFALTTVVLCCSITCNIMGGVLISMGDKRTRKKDVIERMMRQELTAEAIEQMETRWMKEAEERGEIDQTVRKRRQEERDVAESEEIKKSWKVVPSLPKVLLGKGEDHRQPSLPQKDRRSSSNVDVAVSGSSTPKKVKGRGSVPLQPVQEAPPLPSRPEPVLRRGGEPPQEGTGQKIMKFVRRADLDRS